MYVLKIIFLVIAIICVPLLTYFLIRLASRASKALSHLNRTIDDARPQLNMILLNLYRSVEGFNDELEMVGRMTKEEIGRAHV